MNQWVRDALAHADDMSYDRAAEHLNNAKIGQTYDKSFVQKMTVDRKVSLAEATALSVATGYDLPSLTDAGMTDDDILTALDPDDRDAVMALAMRLLARSQAAKQQPE